MSLRGTHSDNSPNEVYIRSTVLARVEEREINLSSTMRMPRVPMKMPKKTKRGENQKRVGLDCAWKKERKTAGSYLKVKDGD